MKQYLLAKSTFMCETAGYAVFLDVKRDRYVALPPRQAALLKKLVRYSDGTSTFAGAPYSERAEMRDFVELARRLESEGLLVTQASQGKLLAPTELPVAKTSLRISSLPSEKVAFRYRWHFLVAWITAAAALRLMPLSWVIWRVRRRKRRSSPAVGSAEEDISRLTTIFSVLRPRDFAAADACLRHSLTLIEFLSRYGIFPDWVFGVQIAPFAAHSWVQYKTTVLNDGVHHVRSFSPVMVV